MAQRKGCYRRVVTTGLVVAIIVAAVGVLLYQRLGGPEGARYWMAERALNAVEAHLLMKASGWQLAAETGRCIRRRNPFSV